MTSTIEPKLADPGAGLPGPERFVARILFALRRMTGSRRSCDDRFRAERELIADLVRSCDVESGARRVLFAAHVA